MSIVISDPVLLKQLNQATTPVEVRDTQGNYIGMFAPRAEGLPPDYKSPFSDAEIERRRQQPDGRVLADILRDLEKRA
jgi:hypothetical protein